ncbi:zonular occludens toxin domain-containing protein [Planctobacterium marinum]|uniref:zonular occludens toxin domain-containing protein n=1 Tax=Planctobacterium marinum TaxID=1631968 RepID=UPI001E423E04|nr:zonular occludens toxin domain-containing protein [Planctobacterium marinum]MCC2604091.1 hypothetical protein [Planctobacterium marinum]
MSIKIHHGPDGTFKTSGAIKDDILKIIKTGRTLITNVRGFSRENTVRVLGEDAVHPDFQVIHIDTDVQAGRDKLARFFHWAPKGAFFVIDEVQRIFPPKWTEKDLRLLDYPENQDHLPETDRRPETIHVAWDMQRHYNWDFVFTTTNIKKVHEMARVMAKVAVRHVNMGLWRFYKTVEHDSESNGKTAASITTVRFWQYVPKKIFELYASTITGDHNNIEPRTPFYKNPKILGMLVFLVCLWGYLLSKPAPKAMGGSSGQTEQKQPGSKGAQVSGKSDRASVARTVSDNSGNKPTAETVLITKLQQQYLQQYDAIYFSGYTKTSNSIDGVFTAIKNGTEQAFTTDDLKALGISFLLRSECLVQLNYGEHVAFYTCPPKEIQEPLQETSI